MYKLVFLLLISCLTLSSLEARSFNGDYAKYKEARKNYASVIGYDNRAKEIEYLKQLIYYGNKLNKNVYKYKKELNRLDRSISLNAPKKTQTKTKPKTVKKYKKPVKTKKSKYSISSVTSNGSQIVINFNRNISKRDLRYFTRKLKSGYQYIFDIKGRFKDAKPTKLSLYSVKRTKIVQYKFNTLRIMLINKTRIKPIYIINKKQIIIKVKGKRTNTSQKVKQSPKANIINLPLSYKGQRKTIVIDAGHGGKDAGAVGPRKRYEKNVVLAVSKYLYKSLKKKGYKVYLTRNRDKYVSLRNRTKLANKRNADMFISIHANAARKSRAKKARGIETYFLSPARSERAKRVAAKENKGDMNSMGWSSQSTFLTVLNQGKITASNKMAIDIQKNMLYSLRQKYGKNTIRDGGVREGPFWVLVGAQMPSILIEVGYISHPTESRRIYTSKYQKIIAKAIANGIDSYFAKNQ